MYYLYNEDDNLLEVDASPVGAEMKKRDLEHRLGIAIYVVKEER